MQISNLSVRNFRSFGNNEQTINFNTDKGEVILITGLNGSGKTSIFSAIDYVLYGKVRGRKKKWIPLSKLPNRINNELVCKINFKSAGSDIEIIRGQNPSTLSLYENGILYERAGKVNIDDRIEKWISMDIDTFKSFVSLSVNDFKNFISLSTEDKQLLLDKLFNLEVINILNEILKGLVKVNKKESDRMEQEILTLSDSVRSIKASIEKSKLKESENTKSEIETVSEYINSKKVEYQALKDKLTKISSKWEELNTMIDKERASYHEINSEIKTIKSKIDLIELGKCPTCESDLSTDTHQDFKGGLEERLNTLSNVKLEVERNTSDLKIKQSKLKDIESDTTNMYNEMNSNLKSYKRKLDELNTKLENTKSEEISEFQKTIDELLEKKDVSEEKLSSNKDKSLYYTELTKIFSPDGIRKSIILNIIKPINHFIAENLSVMGVPFTVVLDENFNAEIKQFGEDIEDDTLSTGENIKCNIAIMVAYLKLIRTKRNINILCLDEVFANIDIEGVDAIIDLLKSFADEYKINIFLVHHAMLNEEYFGKIIKVEKNVFTQLEEIY